MKRKIISVFLVFSMLFSMAIPVMAANLGDFTDIPDNWAKEAIQAAISNGLLSGISAGKIEPNANLTRAQMAAIVNRAFGAVQKGDISKFSDIQKTKWYADDMAKAVKMEAFSGDKNLMRPEDFITRQEAFVVLARAFKLTSNNYSSLDKFNDNQLISTWAKPEVAALITAKYVNGEGSDLSPKANITRAEFAQVLYNIIKTYIKTAGTYTSVTEGNIMINVPDVALKGVTIKGDLIIGDGVGTGNVTLDAVKVEGRTVIRGGGKNSIHVINGSTISGTVIIDNVNNEVRIVTDQTTTVQKIEAGSQVVLEGSFGEVKVVGDASNISSGNSGIEVKGNIQALTVEAKVEVKVTSGTVAKIDITQTANGTTIDTAQGSKVESITANAQISVTGSGTVTAVEAKANGISVETTGTQVTADQGVQNVTAGGKSVAGGTTVNSTGTNTPVVSSGGSSTSSPLGLTSNYTGNYTASTVGVYGPNSGTATVTGSVYVNTAGITLQNLIITGNLTFGAGIENGNAYINNVTVQGKTIVNGGGSNSIHIQGTSDTGVIEVNDQRSSPSGAINISAEGTGSIEAVNVLSPTEVKVTPVTDTIGFVAATDGSTITYGATDNKTALLDKIIAKANYILDNSFTGVDDSVYELNHGLDNLVSDIIDITSESYQQYKISCLKYYINPLYGVSGYEAQYSALETKLISKTNTLEVVDLRTNPDNFNSNMYNNFFPNPFDSSILVSNGNNLGMNQMFVTMKKEVYDRVLQLTGFSDPGDAILNKLKALQNVSALYSIRIIDQDSSGTITAGDKVVTVFKRQLSNSGKAAFEALAPSIGSFGTSPSYSWDIIELNSMSGSFNASRCTITVGSSPSNFRTGILTIPAATFGSFEPAGTPLGVGWLTDEQPICDITVPLPSIMYTPATPSVTGSVYVYDNKAGGILDAVQNGPSDKIVFYFNCLVDTSALSNWLEGSGGAVFGASGMGQRMISFPNNPSDPNSTMVEIRLGENSTIDLGDSFTIPGPIYSMGGGTPVTNIVITLPVTFTP